MPISCLVFDFDGIILESVDVKAKAFASLTAPYGQEAQDLMLMYNKLHGGISRVVKFRWFFDEIVGRSITETELEQWCQRFLELCLEEVKISPLVPGIEQTLKMWHNKLPLYVCSGAPQKELEMLLNLRGLSHYFVGIHGSPPAKEELLRSIAIHSKLPNDSILMIGDSPTDMLAAEAVGTQFYGRGADFKGSMWPWAHDLMELNSWIGNQ